MSKKILVAAMASGALMFTTTACSTTGYDKTAYGGVLGAGLGYLIGSVIGGKSKRTEQIVGAGIGAVAGAGIGYYMDEQEKKLREQTEGSEVDVIRDGDNIILDMPSDVQFGFDSAVVQNAFKPTLDEIAGILNEYPSTYIDVYGHTDSKGTEAYNQRLSEQRAANVAAYLSSQGVNPARMATLGYGETKPKATNTTEEGRAQNRRVEIRITPVTEDDVSSVQ